MADSDLTSALEEIRKRSDWAADRWADPREVRESAADVSPLLAAIEAVLKLADEAYPILSGFSDMSVIGFRLSPAKIREAIERELTGKEKNDGA